MYRRAFSTKTVEAITRECIKVVETSLIGLKAVANKPLKKGQVINSYKAPVFGKPTMHTVCFSETIHVAPTFGAECIAHACGVTVPNVLMEIVDGKSANVVLARDVEEGTDLYFNYCSTEWTMSCPFQCQCPDCQTLGKSNQVQGFSRMSSQQQAELLPFASPYLQTLFAAHTSATKASLAEAAPQEHMFSK
jgi:hypothetical protein